MQLRFAVPSDAGALLRIYDEYINTSITFEYALPGEAEFAARIADISAEYPYLALFDGGVPAAYACAHRAQARRSPAARSARSVRTKCSTCAGRRSANGSQNKKMPRGLI